MQLFKACVPVNTVREYRHAQSNRQRNRIATAQADLQQAR